MITGFFVILHLHLVISQTYTQWTGYGNLSDLAQLPTTTEFRIRHIGGKYLYQNIGEIDTFNEYTVLARCSLDSSYAPISYWTITTKDPAAPNPLNNSFSNCIPDITSYLFTATISPSTHTYPFSLSVCDIPTHLYTWPACGFRSKYWLPTNCDGDLNVVTVYDSLYDYPRYYTSLRVFIEFGADPLDPPVLANHEYWCPTIPNTCYGPGDEVSVIPSCGLNSHQESLWTFEVNAAPDMTINGGSGPTKYYEGYSYLTDLSDGDIVVIRLISGM